MTRAIFAPLVTLPTIIDDPGKYRTRAGDVVTITKADWRNSFGCRGTYADGTAERWHKSGRLFTSRETRNDIVSREDE